MTFQRRTPRLALLSFGLLVACGDDATDLPAGCDRAVAPSADDQTAVASMFVDATDGQTLCFEAGTYRFTDPLEIRSLTGVTIRGAGATPADVVLDFSTQDAGSKGLSGTAMTDFTVENLTVIDASGDNIYMNGCDGVVIRDVVSEWRTRPIESRGKYAIYPVESTDVLIERSIARGSSDAGIYVGQTTRCVVRDSTAEGNVAGIEIENSTTCEVYGNTATGNTGGILVFELPGLPMRGSGTSVHDNEVTSNNLANFAEDGTVVSFLPVGSGMLILAANDVEVYDNTITGNSTAGVALVSYQTLAVLGAPPSTDPEFDPFLEDVYVHGNTFSGNGTMPALETIIGRDVDVLWDGYVAAGADASTLCFRGDGNFKNLNIPVDIMMPITDRTPHDCEKPALPPVMLQ